MEHLKKGKTDVYAAGHQLADPTSTLDPNAEDSFGLVEGDNYRVEFPEGQYWVGTFRGWWGGHGLFFVEKRYNVIAVWHEHIRTLVKRFKKRV